MTAVYEYYRITTPLKSLGQKAVRHKDEEHRRELKAQQGPSSEENHRQDPGQCPLPLTAVQNQASTLFEHQTSLFY